MYWVTRNTGGSLARVEMKRLCTMPSGYRSGLVDIASDKPYTIGDFIARLVPRCIAVSASSPA
jgi:hypothetical protein